MQGLSVTSPRQAAPLRKFLALTKLDEAAVTALEKALALATTHRARTELLREGQPIKATLLIVKGWAARVRYLPDGRRQILSLLLPGDIIGNRAVAASTVVPLTDVRTCNAPSADLSPSLSQAYAVSSAIEEACLLAQITRLGRMNALQKLYDLVLELHERLSLAGETPNGSFDFPMTQDMVADVLGLTAVHVNRTAQQARHEGWLDWHGKQMTIKDPAAMAAIVSRTPLTVRA